MYSTDNNATEVGHTDNFYAPGTNQVTKSTVTIYGGSIDEMQQTVDGGKRYAGTKGHLQTGALKLGNRDAVVAAAAGHERIHATDEQNQADANSNRKQGTTIDTEAAPNANEIKILERAILKDVLKNVPLPIPGKL